jgi:hypothetical protein
MAGLSSDGGLVVAPYGFNGTTRLVARRAMARVLVAGNR